MDHITLDLKNEFKDIVIKDFIEKYKGNTGELVMDIGTILEGEEAVAEGLIDEVGTVSDATEALYEMIKKSKSSKKKSKSK